MVEEAAMSARPRLTEAQNAATESMPLVTPGSRAAPPSTAPGSDLLGFDIVSLTRSAAQLRVDQPAFVQTGAGRHFPGEAWRAQATTFSAFQKLVSQYAGAFANAGLQPGERLLIAGCTSVQSIAAMIGALSVGIDAALAGVHLDSTEIATFATVTGAGAIVTDAGEDDPATAALILGAAAQADCVRLVVSLADCPADGTVSVSAAAAGAAKPAAHVKGGCIITRNSDGMPVTHSQQTLIVAGLDFLARTQLSSGVPIITTIIPASFAGLVCGPLAGLLLGSLTNLHAPFDSTALLHAIETAKPVHLVAPAALAQQIAASSICNAAYLSALVLLQRHEAAPPSLEAPALPPLPVDGIAVSDVAAFDEIAVAAQLRGANGIPARPLEQNHMIHIDGREVLALRAVKHLLENNGVRSTAITFDGAAVSRLDWTYHDATE
jgi:hypothetical protein